LRGKAKGSASRKKPRGTKKTMSVPTGVVYRYQYRSLIENAFDAMSQGGTSTIRSKKSDGNVEIVLADTGSGIPGKVKENLWKPLQTTKARGLGLGLAICKRIMDAHGGSISVKSEVGWDTILTIQLPLRPVEVKQK